MSNKSCAAKQPLPRLVLLRHGLSVANEGKSFGGWNDVGLSDAGIRQARAAGLALKQAGIRFDRAYTSVLKRAVGTLSYCQLALGESHLPTVQDWRLNERHFGELQGMTKAEAEARYGARQVAYWRKDFDARPPLLVEGGPRDLFETPSYSGLSRSEVPLGESLADTHARVLGVWTDSLIPALRDGMNILVVAHGNSIRAMLMEIEGISQRNLSGIDVGNAVPIICHFHPGKDSFLRRLAPSQPQNEFLREILPECR